MIRINFNKLYYFYIVAREGSIKAASDKLNLTQPTISVQIKALEEEIGFALFVRKHKKLILTQNGRTLLKRAETLFNLADELVAELPMMGLRLKDNFRIGTLHSLSSVFVNEFSVDLWQDTLVATTITQGSKESLLEGLDTSEIDFVLSDESSDQGFRYTSVKLSSDRLVAVAGEHFLESVKKFPHSLNSLPYLSFLNTSRTQSEINYYFTRNNVYPSLIGQLDDINLMRRVTEKGLCFSVLPYRAAKDFLELGHLIELGHLQNIEFNLWGVFPSTAANQPIIKKVIAQYFKK